MGRTLQWAKLAAVAALLAVLGAGAALVALKAFLPEPKLRAMVVDGARKQLGREVRLGGITLGLTGLHLSQLEISERPDFSAGTFVRAESFSVRPSWRALLRKKLVIASASADGLSVSVVKAADGSFNYDTLASSAPATPAPAKAAEGPAPEFNVRHLRVRRGSVDYKDAAGSSWAVSDLDLSLDDFSLSEPFSLDVSLRAKGKAGERPVDASLAFTGEIDPARGHREKFSASFKRLVLEQEGLKLSAKGSVKGLTAPSAVLDASLSVSGKTVLTAAGKADVSAPREDGTRAVDADVKLDTPGLDTTVIAKILPGVPAVSIPAVSGAVNGRWDGSSAEAKSFRASWSAGKVEGSGKAAGLGTEKPSYEGKAKFGVDLPEIRPGQYAFLKLPPKAVIPAMRLDGEASYSGDEVRLSPLKAKFKQGTAEASGVVRRLGSAKPVPDLDVKVDLDLPAIAATELPVTSTALPAGFVLPAMRVAGGVQMKGDDVLFQKLKIKGKSGWLNVDGRLAKALAGTPEPDLDLAANLDLPALTDKDLPFPGVPAGLDLPASKWDADVSYTPRLIKLRKLAVVLGSNELTAEGGITDPSGRGAFDLLLKCKRFSLEEITRATPKTRELKLSGGGFFALSVTGTKDAPVFGGKLQFKDLGATVAELPLSGFTGTVSFDERRIDVPNLRGRLADGSLAMDLTVKDYSKAPEVQLEASLDRFDLGKFLSAQKKVSEDRAAAKAAKAARTGKPVEAPKPVRTRGKFEIGTLVHPNATLEKVSLAWDLYGVTADMKKLSGEAKLDARGGSMHAVGDLALQSPIVKVLVYPILLVQAFGGVHLNDFDVHSILGDYLFKDGLMTIRDSRMDTSAVDASVKGTIDLPSEALDLLMTVQVGSLPAADVAVTGTISKPEKHVKIGSILKNAGKNLGENAKGLLDLLQKR